MPSLTPNCVHPLCSLKSAAGLRCGIKGAMAKTKSGTYWVTWANANAKDSSCLDDLVDPFKTNVKRLVKALQDAGAAVDVQNTKRSDKRAYLFHWCWEIGLGKTKPSEAPSMLACSRLSQDAPLI